MLAGSTLGMLLADAPAVLPGKVASPNFTFRLMRWIVAAVFACIGLLVLAGIGF